ncbi:hypothetical protein BUALT_Bualt08G0145800 [Buddleja alternifolia]|uniref:Amino acid transporter transmembrane domain-containing protein n=1 Tax=Buddleja alternifolia TaxID=168488 RepID=A0AAV6XD56_9LAMI|nr:hypothetical protein BUALT_Bualt08G0145800 [Buddleja alternifolia]
MQSQENPALDPAPAPAMAQNGGRRRGLQEAKELNDWLPITASRKGKWWYSAFHNVTAVVGAGVLGLPLVVARLGWYAGLIAIGVSWLVTWYTIWLLVQLHESVAGQRFDRYTELGQHAFGKRLGYWMVMPQQLVVQVGSNIVYMVTGGKSLKKCFGSLDHHADFKKSYYIMIFAFLHLILSQLPNFNSLKIISLTAAVMSISYSMIATGASIVHGTKVHHQGVQLHYGFPSHKIADIILEIFSSLGVLAFAFAGHSVVLEIQATIPSTQEKPSKKPMWRGVIAAYLIVALCYVPVAASGFWAFGNTVQDDVLLSLEHPIWVISIANFMVFVHVLGSYQVFAMPVFDKIEYALVDKFGYTPGRRLRLCARSAYVVATAFVGVLCPFFGGLLGFFGGLAFATTSYILPCLMWLTMKQPKRWSIHNIACRGSIFIGILITILAPIGGAYEIVVNWKTYHFWD